MLNPTNQSLLYSPGCQTLWVCSDLTRSSSWTHSCLHYFTWHLISRSFLTCPNPSYSRSALLTSSLCLFSSIQEGELFLYFFLSVSVACAWICRNTIVTFTLIQIWESFDWDELRHLEPKFTDVLFAVTHCTSVKGEKNLVVQTGTRQ